MLQNYERMNLADALVSKSYDNGERIIKQGKWMAKFGDQLPEVNQRAIFAIFLWIV